MECSKHFSHHHPLLFHQVPHGSQTHCSGCKSPASGNVYVCCQCSYFLHEQCFRAARSLHHPSHPLHHLTLVPFPTYPSANFFCNSCNLAGDGFSYSCSACEFDIHLHCALSVLPNPNPQPQQFNAHPQDPTYPSQSPTTTNHPPLQTYNYCANPPPGAPLNILKHFSHPHALKHMEIKAENANICSACQLQLSGSTYGCTEHSCTFRLHKSFFDYPSVNSEMKVSTGGESIEEELMRLQQQKINLALQMQKAKEHAEFLLSL